VALLQSKQINNFGTTGSSILGLENKYPLGHMFFAFSRGKRIAETPAEGVLNSKS